MELAWLAADRAMTTATGDAVLVATATVQLGQVLRTSGRARMARSTALAAAYRIVPPDLDDAPAAELSLCGTLVMQAALAACPGRDVHTTAELLDEAAGMAARVGDGHDHPRTGFGPVAVDLARVAAARALLTAERTAPRRHSRRPTSRLRRPLPALRCRRRPARACYFLVVVASGHSEATTTMSKLLR
ncbi:hypothetical protein ACWCHM_08400 [Micromonospora sp. SCSIO 07396]